RQSAGRGFNFAERCGGEKRGGESRVGTACRQGDRREVAGEKGRKRGLRSRRLHFPWQSEGAGRCRARRRIKILRWHHRVKADDKIAARTKPRRREVIRLRKSFLSIVARRW